MIPRVGEGFPDVARLLGLRKLQARREMCGDDSPTSEQRVIVDRMAQEQTRRDLAGTPYWEMYWNAVGKKVDRESTRIRRGKMIRPSRREKRRRSEQLAELQRQSEEAFERLDLPPQR